jgi:hypothetical protein
MDDNIYTQPDYDIPFDDTIFDDLPVLKRDATNKRKYNVFDEEEQYTRINSVKDAMLEVFKFIDHRNREGSHIKASVITFNNDAVLHEKRERDSFERYCKKIDFQTTGLTDFVKAFKLYGNAKREDTISVFLSDGEHNGPNDFILSGDSIDDIFDISVRITDVNESIANSTIMKKVGKKFVLTDKKEEIQNSLIGTIFKGISAVNSKKVSVLVPAGHKFTRMKNMMDGVIIPKPTQFVTSENVCIENDKFLHIKPVITTANLDADVIFVIDTSASMKCEFRESHKRVQHSFLITDEDEDILNELNQAITDDDNNIMEEVEQVIDELQTGNIDDVMESMNILSVFDAEDEPDIIISSSSTYNYIEYELTDPFNFNDEAVFELQNRDQQHPEEIFIKIDDEVIKVSHVSNTVEPIIEKMYQQTIILYTCLLKVYASTDISLREDYITECYAHVTNTNFVAMLKSLEINLLINNMYVILSSLINQINNLYEQIIDKHDNYHRRMCYDIEGLDRDIMTQNCKLLTSQASVRTASQSIEDSFLPVTSSICCICMCKPRSIVFNCGHMATCSDCAKKILVTPKNTSASTNNRMLSSEFNSEQITHCPICRSTIHSIISAKVRDFESCVIDGCNMNPTILTNCRHISFCKSCWKKELKKTTDRHKCYCGESVTKAINIILS